MLRKQNLSCYSTRLDEERRRKKGEDEQFYTLTVSGSLATLRYFVDTLSETGVVHDSCFNWFQTLLSVSHWFELLSCFLTNYVLHNYESIHVTIDCQFAVQQNTVMFYNKLSCVQCIRLEMNFPNYFYVSVSIYDQTNLQYEKKV